MTCRSNARSSAWCVGAALLFHCLAPIALAAQHDPPSWTAEQQSVLDAVGRGPVGIESDFDRWAGSYGPEWTYWRMGRDEVRPRDVHMDLVRGVLADGNRITAFDMEPVDVVVLGDVAQLRYNAEETIVAPDGTVTVVEYSAVSLLMREDGRWLLRTSSLFYPEE